MVRYKHGHSKPIPSPEYRCWKDMRARCNKSGHRLYPYYGGRGIKVCDEWNDFVPFLEHVGRRPSSDHSLDRIENSKGYEPGNVKWATRIEQQNNTRQNVKVHTDDGIFNMREYCRRFGISYGTMKSRRYRARKAGKVITKVFGDVR